MLHLSIEIKTKNTEKKSQPYKTKNVYKFKLINYCAENNNNKSNRYEP